jgi:hypothetical protein
MHKNGDNLKLISRNMKDARAEYYTHFIDVVRKNVLAEQCG